MIDSTARAQRFEGDSSPAPAYLWAPAQKPVSVSIPFAVIDKLEHEAVESFRSLSSRGSEIGGLLFGTVMPGSPLAVTIESCEPVECSYSGGPLYRLTEVELARLDRAIEQKLAAGARPVGFYRSHTRKGLSLDADDLALLDSRFPEAHQIALLIRPAATRASMAGIFIREDGKVNGEKSCQEFPFRSSQHEPTKRDEGLYEGAVAGPRSVNAAPATAPKPVIRAQIVPIASRREVLPETPLAAPPPPAPERPEAAPPAPAPPVASVEPKAAPVAQPPAPPAAAPVVDAAPAIEKPRSNKLLWIVAGTAASLVLIVGLFFSSAILHIGNRNAPAPSQDTSPLALRVDRNNADIVLTWNRDSDAIKKASRAVLSIADGPQHENVEMDLTQLKNGSIVYSPVTGDVVFRMEVSGADQMKTVSESVRVLRTRPSPMADTPGTPEPAQQAQQPQGAPKTGSPADASAQPAPAAPVEEEKVALAQAVKPFRAAALAQRLHAATVADLPDGPVIGVPAPGANVNLGAIVGTQAAPPPSAPAAEKASRSGGQIQQAQLIRRRDPEYPKLARDSGASGIVELTATVAADGRVRTVQVVRGHPLLRQAAVDAVKSWVYRPTLLNGVAVESQTQVLLNFKPDR